MKNQQNENLVVMMIGKHDDFANRYFARSITLAITIIIIKQFNYDPKSLDIMGLPLSGLGLSNVIGLLGILCLYFLFYAIVNTYMVSAIWTKNFGRPNYTDGMLVTNILFLLAVSIAIIFSIFIYGYAFSLAKNDMYQVVKNIISSLT